jgi:glycosyltransferase involved in cell wall biosynthesis
MTIDRLTVVIPTRDEPTAEWCASNITVQTLQEQAGGAPAMIPVWDERRRGAPWARNEGFKRVDTELVLFSDDDIEWRPDALKGMIRALDDNPEASYSYGSYWTNWTAPDKVFRIGHRPFDAAALRQRNYVSTMSVIRAKDFPGFDESLKRLQDWDLWLRMLAAGKVGVFCGQEIFTTEISRTGITFGTIPHRIAHEIVARKNDLPWPAKS